MQYCNDCFAKMEDKAKRCPNCQSRDLHMFTSDVSAETTSGIQNPATLRQKQVSTAVENEGSLPQRKQFKLDPMYVVEPKHDSSKSSTKGTHYFPSDKKAKRKNASRSAKAQRLSRKAAGGRPFGRKVNVSKWSWKPISIFIVSSVILTIILNSTIWAYEGNPLGVQEIARNLNSSSSKGSTAQNLLPLESNNEIIGAEEQATEADRQSPFEVNVASAFFDDGERWYGSGKVLVLNIEYSNAGNLYSCFKPEVSIQGSDLYLYKKGLVAGVNAEEHPCLEPGQVAFETASFKTPDDLEFYKVQVKGYESNSKTVVSLGREKIGSTDPGFVTQISLDTTLPSVGGTSILGNLKLKLAGIKATKFQATYGPPDYLVAFDLVVENLGEAPEIIPTPFVYSSNGRFYRTTFQAPANSDELTSPLTFGGVPGGEIRRSTFLARLDTPGALEFAIRSHPLDGSTAQGIAKFYLSKGLLAEAFGKSQ